MGNDPTILGLTNRRCTILASDQFFCSPSGIRTHIKALEEPCTNPLYDGTIVYLYSIFMHSLFIFLAALKLREYLGRDLNPYIHYRTRDFKSLSATSYDTEAILFVTEEGVEPSRPYGHHPLKMTWLPLHHSASPMKFFKEFFNAFRLFFRTGAHGNLPWFRKPFTRGGLHELVLLLDWSVTIRLSSRYQRDAFPIKLQSIIIKKPELLSTVRGF